MIARSVPGGSLRRSGTVTPDPPVRFVLPHLCMTAAPPHFDEAVAIEYCLYLLAREDAQPRHTQLRGE